MSFPAGTRLGPYEIQGLLGAGGMGEVWRARHTKLQRDVAIKVLPEPFAADPERLARFEREAQLLAALSHTNIAAIYGAEEQCVVVSGSSRTVHALILELVEGPTLADRIAQGSIPLDEALPIARQIAEALEAAHEQGIIHRDLKPANIKVRPDGTVKVLDFGLAKLTDPGGAGASGAAGPARAIALSQSPTITSPAMMGTAVGVILGTAAYMSPEQARGKPVDRRTDIWAFGCVLYEMLAGMRAFGGDDVTDTLAAIVRDEPDFSRLPRGTPASIRRLLRRCLQKDPRRRWPDIGAARIEVEEEIASPASSTGDRMRPLQRPLVPWLIAAVAMAAALSVSVWHFGEVPSPPMRAIRFTVSPPPGTALLTGPEAENNVALSPDGQRLAFYVTKATSVGTRLAVRAFDAADAQDLDGTDGAAGAFFWSPDSRFVAFFAGGKLKTVEVTGGQPRVIADAPLAGGAIGGSWSTTGTILFAQNAGGLLRVPAGGGTPMPATTLDASKKEVTHLWPWFLPDGRHFLYVASSSENPNAVFVGSLDGGAAVPIGPSESRMIYADGHLLFIRKGALVAQPFDAVSQAVSGDPVAVAQDVRGNPISGSAAFSASVSGLLAYKTATAAALTQLVFVDRQGTVLDAVGEPADQAALQLSPDGSRVAVSVLDGPSRARHLWIHDLRRNVRTRVTFSGDDWTAVWSPDGTRLVFSAARAEPLDLFERPANASGMDQRLLTGSRNKYPTSWSPDGRFILYYTGSLGSTTGNDLWMLPLSGDATPEPFLQTPFNEQWPRLSPDGRWVAYDSNQSGRTEVYVMPFAGPRQAWQVSSDGGSHPRWRGDSNELFYLKDSALMAASVHGQGDTFIVDRVQRLFEAPLRTDPYFGFGTGSVYDVTADGQRFLINKVADQQPHAPSSIHVIANWQAAIRAGTTR